MAEAADDDDWEAEGSDTGDEASEDAVSYDISYYPADFTLKGYLDKFNANQIIVPDFQRNYVWDRVKASKLIESFLLGLPVPGVFLYKERKTNKLQVIDGQQRILSAVRFFTGHFEESKFRLKGVRKRWEGKAFAELSEPEQLQLSDSVLRATVVQQLDPTDDSSIYHIFERLNTGGMNLVPMEIRKCVYHGEYFDHLERLNHLDSWRRLIGRPRPDKRHRDVELVLRTLALARCHASYEKPMKQFLNRYMAAALRLSSADQAARIAQETDDFTTACEAVFSALGEKPFQLRSSRLNFAFLDSFMGALIESGERDTGKIHAAFERLKSDQAFVESASISTSDDSVLKKRFVMSITEITQ